MWRTVLVSFAALSASACLRHTSYSSCRQDSDCAAAGASPHCETNGACSVDDMSCPSGRKYSSSAPEGAVCVPGGSFDASMVDATPIAAGRECVQGSALPSSYGNGCAAMVDAKEPRCGTERWDAVCVRWAEMLCQLPCSQIAFVGSISPIVLRLSDHAILWQDAMTDGNTAGAWADYDNDGDPDLAIAGDTQLRIFRNDGYDATAGTLSLTQVIDLNWGTIQPTYSEFRGADVNWVDVDGDGALDAVFGGTAGLIELRNMGDSVFVQQAPFEMVSAPADSDADPGYPNVVHSAWGDYDHDGWIDLAVVRFGRSPTIYQNDHGTLHDTGWAPDETGTYNPNFGGGVAWCNVDGDPDPELVSSGYSYVFIADNTGGQIKTSVNLLDTMQGSDIECGDFDGDGDLDLVVSGDEDIPSRAFRNGAGTVSSFATAWTDTTAESDKLRLWNAAVGDVDGDHHLDFLGGGVLSNAPDMPMQYERFVNAGNLKFTPGPLTVLSQPIAQNQGTSFIVLAPAIGH